MFSTLSTTFPVSLTFHLDFLVLNYFSSRFITNSPSLGGSLHPLHMLHPLVFAKISSTNCLFLTLIWKRPPLVLNFQYSAWLSLIWFLICKIKYVFFFTFFTSSTLWVFICKIQKRTFFVQFLQCLSPPRMFLSSSMISSTCLCSTSWRVPLDSWNVSHVCNT